MTEEQWIERAFAELGESADSNSVREVIDDINRAWALPEFQEAWTRLDCDAEFHRRAHYRLFAAAGLRQDLADALYAVESDPACNPFATDVRRTLRTLAERHIKIAIVSDIHFDLRPVFERSDLLGFVDVFVLSYEHGVQKPDPNIFRIALEKLDVEPEQALMVGDRPNYDGSAVTLGVPTMLLAPLKDAAEERLHFVLKLVAKL